MDDIPRQLQLDDVRLRQLAGSGPGLADRIARGDVFLQSYDFLQVHGSTELQQDKFVAPATVLFCYAPDLSSPFAVAPLAILCASAAGDGEQVVLTPLDEDRWNAAKKLVDVADVHDAELRLHLARTHSMMVPFAMAMHRQLPKNHVVRELLLPHLRFMLFIEFMGWREGVKETSGVLIRSLGGRAEWSHRVTRSVHHDYTFRELGFESDLAARGMDSHAVDYPYRDDGRLLFQAIHRFVTRYIHHCYTSDDAVVADAQLQAFVTDAAAPDGGNVRGLLQGDKLTTRSELIDILSELIFMNGPLHSLCQYSLAAHLQYADVNPAFLRTHPLGPKVSTGANGTGDAAPTRAQTRDQVVLVHRTNIRYDTLGDYREFALGKRGEFS